MACALCAAQDGLQLGMLCIAQGVLLKKLGVALYDGQRCFQVMGQCGDLLGALLFHPPLRLQTAGQLAAHCL